MLLKIRFKHLHHHANAAFHLCFVDGLAADLEAVQPELGDHPNDFGDICNRICIGRDAKDSRLCKGMKELMKAFKSAFADGEKPCAKFRIGS